VAEELTTPYDGEGHHFPIPKRLAGRLGIPKALRDSPLNVLKPRNMNTGDFYELHYRVDPKSNSNRLPDSVGGGSWKGKNIPGLRKYPPFLREWHAIPDHLRLTIGGGAVAGTGVADQTNEKR